MNTLINVMAKYNSFSSIKNLQYHNYQTGKATGNRDDKYKRYNFDVLEMNGIKTIDNYMKYINEHAHYGNKAHLEELGENDFIIPKRGKDIRLVESIIVCPPEKVYLKDIKNYDFSKLQLFFDDYITFLKKDKKLKDIEMLSAKVHCNEVFYPRFIEVPLPDGTTKIRLLSEEESKEYAYIKPHMHIDYIPLVEAEKDGKKYKKLCSNEIWKADSGKYYTSYREYNDRCYEEVGKAYGYERGEKWEEWAERVQKVNNGEIVKQNKALYMWQIEEDKKHFQAYVEQIKENCKREIEKIKRAYDAQKLEIIKSGNREIFQLKKETEEKIENAKKEAQEEVNNVLKSLGTKNADYGEYKGYIDSELADYILR